MTTTATATTSTSSVDEVVLLDSSDDSLTVSWPAVKGAKTYHLQYRPVAHGASDDKSNFTSLSSTLSATQARKKNLTADGSYEFRVAADDSEAWITHSDAFRVLTRQAHEQRMSAPTAVPSGNFAALVQWQKSPHDDDDDKYELQMREAVGGAAWVTVAASLSSTEARKRNLRGARGYQFRVRRHTDKEEEELPFSPPSPVVVAYGVPVPVRNLFSSLEDKELLKGGGTARVPLEDALGGKEFIGVYVSAHWCGPCRQFTPQLMQFYHASKSKVEIVFVSADHDSKGFTNYYASMPWLAVPFEDDAREEIMGQLRVSGIPRLVVWDGRTGRVVEDNAVQRPLQLGVWRQLRDNN